MPRLTKNINALVEKIEILTGQHPLQAEAPVQWVHAHFVQKPLSPSAMNSEIPPVVSGIVMKLLDKNPAGRYQSGIGLCRDLEECSRQWIESGVIALFPLGRLDIPKRFQLPQKLYGREKETDIDRSVRRGVFWPGCSNLGKRQCRYRENGL